MQDQGLTSRLANLKAGNQTSTNLNRPQPQGGAIWIDILITELPRLGN